MINIEEMYHEYLLSKGDEHRQKYEEFKGWFSASSAGSCHLKQWFKINDYDEKEQEVKPLRVMRLGTLVHKDLEEAIEFYKKKHSDIFNDKAFQIYSEHQIRLPEIKVVGHLDIAVNAGKLYVYDFKTAHSFKWRKMFGRTKNRDPKPSVNYQLQLGTYALGMIKETGVEEENVEMGLIWYKKDDSTIKQQIIENSWIDNAFYYWTELYESIEEEGKPKLRSYNTPVYDWECKYCPYHKIHCEGV